MTQQQTADGAAARHKYVFEIQRAAENFTLTRLPHGGLGLGDPLEITRQVNCGSA